MDQENTQAKKTHRINLLFPLILILAVTVYTLFSGNSGTVLTTAVDSETLGVANAVNTVFVPLSDIESVKLVADLNIGTPLSDEDECIDYTNESFGPYRLFAYEDAPSYVIIHTADGVIAIGDKTEKKTENLYDALSQALAETE